MPNLDIATLSFVAVFCSFIYLLMLVLITFVHKKTRGLKVFSAGFACFFVGFFLLGYRGLISDWLTIVAANSLICIGVSCIRIGLCQFLGLNRQYYIYELWLLVAVVLALYFFTFVNLSVGARIINISSYIAIISFACSWQLLQIKDSKMAFAQLLAAVPFLITGFFHVFRTIYAIFEASIDNFMQAGAIHQLSFLVMIFLILMSTFGMLFLVTTKLENKLLLQNITDNLTGLYNRRIIDNQVSVEVARTKRHDLQLSVLMIDLDFFKVINDSHGHQVGDTVLTNLAQRLHENIRVEDIAIRYGGEEFLIILPETDLTQAINTAEKLRKVISNTPLCNSPRVIMTASFGVGTMNKDESLDNLITRVDNALYQAKDEGRDKVVSS